MRTILINLPWSRQGRYGVRAGSRWPFTSIPQEDGYIRYIPFPFFLAYATALLKKEGKTARLIDVIAEGIDEQETVERVTSYNPELIIAETSTPSFENDIRIIRDIHQKLFNCQIGLCGPHASVFPEQILTNYSFINYVLCGEYEYTLLDLVNSLEHNLGLESVSGLAYRSPSGVITNKPRATIDDLDALPWPERDDVPIYKYNDGFAGLPQPNAQLWASRGCPFQCIFCLWPQTIYREHKYRKRTPANIVDEMAYLIDRFNFKAIYFDDDIFNMDKGQVLDICREIKKRGIKIPWAAMARADLMDEELLNFMSDAGLYAIKYGVESVDQNILNFCKKNMNITKANQMIKFTKRKGVKVHLAFCLGLPGETARTIQKTLDFIREITPDSFQFSLATPFPGTEYFRYVKEDGELLSEAWTDYDGTHKCVVRTAALASKELKNIISKIDNYFYLQHLCSED